MPFRSLGEFLRELERRGLLIRIKEPLSPVLEITEVIDRVSK
ncbi:MAG: UbiD family decarboxylase, partial [Aquificota bacterium]|nr:UbiD family decarboxylase [Aquificota bacterium]